MLSIDLFLLAFLLGLFTATLIAVLVFNIFGDIEIEYEETEDK